MPVNVLDIGSSKLRLMVADKGVNNTFIIHSSVELSYDGYLNGEFVKPEELETALRTVIKAAERESKQEIENIIVGVPFEFCTAVCKEQSVGYSTRRIITESDMWKFYKSADDYKENESLSLIAATPISLVLEDGRKVQNAIGEKTSKIAGEISFVYAESSFIKLINNVMKNIGICKLEYVAEPTVQGTYIIPEEDREMPVTIIDSGFLSTSVYVMQGRGLRMLSSFSIGLGHIINDLSEGLDLTYEEADLLKKQILLSLSSSALDNYEISRSGATLRVPQEIANKIVSYRLDMIAQAVNKCIMIHYKENPNYPIFLTGGGISRISGTKDYLSKCMGKNIEYAVPGTPIYNKPWYSSRLGLLHYAVSSEKKKGGLLAKILKK